MNDRLPRYVLPVLLIAATAAPTTADDQRKQLVAAVAAVERFELTDHTLPAWRDHILPTSAELAWERIAWLPSFSAGLIQSDATDRPLLLWVMNGHPLGCT